MTAGWGGEEKNLLVNDSRRGPEKGKEVPRKKKKEHSSRINVKNFGEEWDDRRKRRREDKDFIKLS